MAERAAVDADVFEELRADIGSDHACADFVEIFLDLLPGRLHDLTTSLRQPTEPWEPAGNLAATCRMLGAFPLAEHLEQIRPDAPWLESEDCIRAHLTRTFDLAQLSRVELRRQVVWLRRSA